MLPNVLQLIYAWMHAAQGRPPVDPDAFFRFMAAWVAFNATYVHEYGSGVGDRAGAMQFARESESQDRHVRFLAKDTDYRVAVEVLAERGVLNLRNQVRLHITDPADFTQVMAVIYQIRCNLFHGGKVPADARDSSLVRSAHKILGSHLSARWPRATG